MKTGVIGFGVAVLVGVSAPALAQSADPAPAAAPAAAPTAAPAGAPAGAAAAPAAPAATPETVPAEAAPAGLVEDGGRPAAGERTANNALYLELLGSALFYSLNYDRRIGDVALRAGIMYFSVSATGTQGDSASASWIGVPLSVSYVGIGSAKHSFELGGGITIHHFSAGVNTLGVDSTGSATKVLGHAILGYRYQPVSTGFFLRAGLTPVIGSGVFLPWPHVGLGATF